jgi:hypothetical protein
MSDYKDLLKISDPIEISDDNFRIYHEFDMLDEDTSESTGVTKISLHDSDGDGELIVRYNAKGSTVTVELQNMFGQAIVCSFYRKQFKEFIKIMLASFEVNDEFLESAKKSRKSKSKTR